jgi:Putative auto-transporter adhesin, head GIN domain
MTTAPASLDGRRPSRRLLVVGLVLVVLLVGAVLLFALRDELGLDGKTAEMVVGSGVVATEPRDVESFGVIELAGASNVSVRLGGDRSVVVEADDNLVPLVETDVRDAVLVVRTRGSFTSANETRVLVTVPVLGGIRLSGTGAVDIEGIEGITFDVVLSGSGTITASGSTDELTASVSGVGSAMLDGLEAGHVVATVSGAGKLEVRATDRLDATVSGAGAILYSGHPMSVTRNVTGVGAIVER